MMTKEEIYSRDRNQARPKRDLVPINFHIIDNKNSYDNINMTKKLKGNNIQSVINEENKNSNNENNNSKGYLYINNRQSNYTSINTNTKTNFQIVQKNSYPTLHARKLSLNESKKNVRSISPITNANLQDKSHSPPLGEKLGMTKNKFTLSNLHRLSYIGGANTNNGNIPESYNSTKFNFGTSNGIRSNGQSSAGLNNFLSNEKDESSYLPNVSTNIKTTNKNKIDEVSYLNEKINQFDQIHKLPNELNNSNEIPLHNKYNYNNSNNVSNFTNSTKKELLQAVQNGINYKENDRELTPNNRKFIPRESSDRNLLVNGKLKIQKSYSPISISKDVKKIEDNERDQVLAIKKAPVISKYAFKSKQGMTQDGNFKTNQDSFLTKTKIFNLDNYSVFGVFDGHGLHGHFVSNFIKLFFTDYFARPDLFLGKEKILTANMNSTKRSIGKYNSTNSNIKEDTIYNKLFENNYYLIKSSYSLAESALVQSKYEVNFSGATCVIVILVGDKLICANAGDSRAILVVENQEKAEGKIIPLSRDHKPELKDENMRIIKSGGRVDRYTDNGIKSGPFRVWLKNENFPGLAMSRSVGDFVAGSVGVICEPEIFELNVVDYSCKFIVIASDGVWEFLSNEKVTEIVNWYYKINDPNGAADKIVEESIKKWRQEDEVIDDITAIVIFFNKQQ